MITRQKLIGFIVFAQRDKLLSGWLIFILSGSKLQVVWRLLKPLKIS